MSRNDIQELTFRELIEKPSEEPEYESTGEILDSKLEVLLRSELTDIRFPPEYELEDVIGETCSESLQVSSSDHFFILSVFEDVDLAKELDSPDDYQVISEEFVVWECWTSARGGPEVDISPIVMGPYVHRKDERQVTGPVKSLAKYQCTCDKTFSSEERLELHTRGKTRQWDEKYNQTLEEVDGVQDSEGWLGDR